MLVNRYFSVNKCIDSFGDFSEVLFIDIINFLFKHLRHGSVVSARVLLVRVLHVWLLELLVLLRVLILLHHLLSSPSTLTHVGLDLLLLLLRWTLHK